MASHDLRGEPQAHAHRVAPATEQLQVVATSPGPSADEPVAMTEAGFAAVARGARRACQKHLRLRSPSPGPLRQAAVPSQGGEQQHGKRHHPASLALVDFGTTGICHRVRVHG